VALIASQKLLQILNSYYYIVMLPVVCTMRQDRCSTRYSSYIHHEDKDKQMLPSCCDCYYSCNSNNLTLQVQTETSKQRNSLMSACPHVHREWCIPIGCKSQDLPDTQLVLRGQCIFGGEIYRYLVARVCESVV
jgi:hypothetical protein